MNWAGAIAKNRDDLLEIATRLFVLAGIRTGRTVIALPRHLRIRILALLRPAEFAARRLIAIAACKLVVVAVRSVVEREERAPSSVILGLEPRTHSVKPATSAKMKNKASSSIVVSLHDAHGMGPRVRPEDDVRGMTSPLVAKTPRGNALPAFPLFDPFKRFGHPWLEDGEDGQAGAWLAPQTALAPDDPIDARALYGRILALERALQDLDGQAARLARWRARRTQENCRPRRFSPLRPGRPPGWRKWPKTALEEVLKECDFLARDAWNTS